MNKEMIQDCLAHHFETTRDQLDIKKNSIAVFLDFLSGILVLLRATYLG